jgi:hypothetical protein
VSIATKSTHIPQVGGKPRNHYVWRIRLNLIHRIIHRLLAQFITAHFPCVCGFGRYFPAFETEFLTLFIVLASPDYIPVGFYAAFVLQSFRGPYREHLEHILLGLIAASIPPTYPTK